MHDLVIEMRQNRDMDNDDEMQQVDGTDIGISLAECMLSQRDLDRFKNLLRGLIKDADGTLIMTYQERMREINDDIQASGGRILPGSRSVYIDQDALHEFDPVMETAIINNPIATLEKLSSALDEIFAETYPEMDSHDPEHPSKFHLTIRILGDPGKGKSGFDDLDASKIGKIISMRGVVTMITAKAASGKVMLFKCTSCNAPPISIVYDDFKPYTPPPKSCPSPECPSHSSRSGTSWDFKIYDSDHINVQTIVIQEDHDSIGASSEPRNCKIVLSEDLVGVIKAGSKVIVSGVLMAVPSFQVFKKSFDPPLMIQHVHCTGVKTENADKSIIESITEERRKEVLDIMERAKTDVDGYFNYLIGGIAPAIFGYTSIKHALLLALIGAQAYYFPGNTSSRPYIHVLLLGDPGTAKTRLLKAVEYLVAKYAYVTGNQVTSAGLTAAAIQSQKGKPPELHVGAAVLADGGIIAVDEFNQLNQNDKPAFLEFMETGTVTIDKFGFHEKLNARTTVVAAANPQSGRVNKTPSKIKDNYKGIWPPLLNRFDFIFLIEDMPNKENDGQMADMVLDNRQPQYVRSIHGTETHVVKDEATLNLEKQVRDVRDIIMVARQLADERPLSYSKEAKKIIRTFYVEKRIGLINSDNTIKYDKPIYISMRQLEGIARASEAYAILRGSPTIDVVDVTMATKIVDESMKDSMIDEDGNVDASTFETKESHAEVSKEEIMLMALNELQEKNDTKGKKFKDGVETDSFKEYVIDQVKNLTPDLFKKHLKALVKKGLIEEFQGTKIRITEMGKQNL